MEIDSPRPYIGITGFTLVEEIRAVRKAFFELLAKLRDKNFLNNDIVEPQLMVGILTNPKTFNGMAHKFPGRYPKLDQLRTLFKVANACNTLVLCHHCFSGDPSQNIIEDSERIMNVTGNTTHGFQLNVCWPDSIQVMELRRLHPKMHIILQIGGKALSKFAKLTSTYDPNTLLKRVREYEGSINSILLDPSGGFGQLLKKERLTLLVKTLMQIENLGIGVAGGLCAETMGVVAPMAAICPYLSIDAEGRLRNPKDDSLELEKTKAYLTSAFQVLYGL